MRVVLPNVLRWLPVAPAGDGGCGHLGYKRQASRQAEKSNSPTYQVKGCQDTSETHSYG
jgi:hypothetical protein